MKKFFVILLAAIPFMGLAQEEKKFGIKLSGYVKSDLFFDTHETVSAREGYFMLFPTNENLDPDGIDMDQNLQFHFLSIQSRLKATLSGPDALGAKTSGVVEMDFFGTTNDELNGARLRHAFVKLDWPKTSLLVGQYWHPMFNTKCFPGTVSFNTGAPFEPFSRNPQIRVTRKFGKINLSLTAMGQKDHVNLGPAGGSTKYLRNSGIPAMNIAIEYHSSYETGKELLLGASFNVKSIQPQTVSGAGYQTTSQVTSIAFSGLAKYVCKPVTIKLHGFYGSDASNLIMIGGYAIRDTIDPVRGIVEYSPISNMSFWTDIHTNGKTWQFGVFGGYTKNLGAANEILEVFYSRGSDIDYIYRASGRIMYNNGRFRVAPEVEYTAAAYATRGPDGDIAWDEFGKVSNSKIIGNLRVLIGTYFFF